MLSAIVIILGYVFGNFPTGLIVGKLNNIDIRQTGSGNIGSTNALRTLGFLRGGLPTLVGDILKVVIPCLLVKHLICPGLTGNEIGYLSTDYFVLLCGFGVVLGHNFPAVLGFHGGKGIASTGGAFLVFNFPMTMIPLAVFILVCYITKYVSLGSMIGLISIPVTIAVFYPGQWALVLVASLYAILGIARHKSNIERLMKGTENKLGKKKD